MADTASDGIPLTRFASWLLSEEGKVAPAQGPEQHVSVEMGVAELAGRLADEQTGVTCGAVECTPVHDSLTVGAEWVVRAELRRIEATPDDRTQLVGPRHLDETTERPFGVRCRGVHQ